MSNGTDGALLDPLRGGSSIFDRARFLGPKYRTPISKFAPAFSGLNRVPIGKFPMAQMEPSRMRLRSHEGFWIISTFLPRNADPIRNPNRVFLGVCGSLRTRINVIREAPNGACIARNSHPDRTDTHRDFRDLVHNHGSDITTCVDFF
jgi:hypothetical protein